MTKKFIIYQINHREISTQYEECDLSSIDAIHIYEVKIKDHLNCRRKAKIYRKFFIFPAFRKIKHIQILYWRTLKETNKEV